MMGFLIVSITLKLYDEEMEGNGTGITSKIEA